MRNRALHAALRDFALESAALLTEEVRAGAELEFDVMDEGGPRGPALYRYRPRVEDFVGARWERLRALPAGGRAKAELGAGAAAWLRVNGMAGEQAEPALRAMLERLYEDATSFAFPEERFERVYAEVEDTLYRDVVSSRIVAPLHGVELESERVDLGDGLSLMRADRAGLPPEAAWAEDGLELGAACVLERDTAPDDALPAVEAADRFAQIVTALRLFRGGAASLGPVAWRRTGEGRWSAVALEVVGGFGGGRGEACLVAAEDERVLCDLFAALGETEPVGSVAWALARFEIGCSQPFDAEALSDYLLALRALLDANSDAGQASMALRVAALCAEEGHRRVVQRRIEQAVLLERVLMGGRAAARASDLGPEPPGELVDEVEGHLRALLRDVLCGYLDADLKGTADDILLEVNEPFVEIQARDLRVERREEVTVAAVAAEPEVEPEQEVEPEPELHEEVDTTEFELLEQPELEGVTASGDWGWDDAEDFSAPV